MYIPTKRKKNSANKPQIEPGIYPAIVTDVKSAQGFAPDEAIDVSYDVSIDDSTVISHSERFSLKQHSPRTAEIDGILDSIESDNYADLVGLKMMLEFCFQFKNYKRYCNIVSHTLIEEGGDCDDN